MSLGLFLRPLFLMIGMSEAHHLWAAIVPAAGYWSCFLLMFLISSFHEMKKRWWER